MLGIHIFAMLFYVASVASSVYPTRPIAKTVMGAGRLSSVTWINDKTWPSLSEMGPMKIDLYLEDDTFVATLAKNVDPTRRSQKIWISPTWGPNGSEYHMRFICETPPLTVYTADFTITAMDDTSPFQGAEKAVISSTVGGAEAAMSTSSAIAPYPSSPSTMTTSSTVSSTTQTSSPTSTTSSPTGTQTHNPYMNKAKTGASGGGLWTRTTVDLERVKFRLVFILWPMMIGITMAI
ncbi:uncharacterized protein FIBRA_03847 [Fibroporia radiculosa]|uniref:Uncharacterized protein n=1 Tax=Fibroporia radiculosa TaxID=599839 RepID=J4GNQ1_9APHY|nr:uncharacterized protein FIBRA_03847 [Fibroporia radiculosa]CCM01780.1 predicted protein [Fibroporia radiculosa]